MQHGRTWYALNDVGHPRVQRASDVNWTSQISISNPERRQCTRYCRQGFHGAGSILPNASESAPFLRATLRLRANAERDGRLVGRPRHPDQVHEEHVLERQGLHERLVVEREDAVPGSLACQ